MVINNLAARFPENIVALDMPQNGGKASAVRYGMLHAANHFDTVEFIGFLDADLATSLDEMRKIGTFIQRNDYFRVVVGSRIVRLGANIQRFGFRKIASKVIQQFIAMILQLEFQDTQCGAKMFQKEVIDLVFAQDFKTDWLFDVEIFLRFRKAYGKVFAQQHIYELPLEKWVNAEGSKVTMKEILRTPFMLMKIAYNYNFRLSY
jgi:glycosyltransferase involved in cell wall biosynthesis